MTDSSLAPATPSPAGPSGPTALSERSLAPDLARGGMLLFIALANSHTFLHHGGETIRAYPSDGSVLDSIVAAILTMFVDGRSYTMFAALFGYGLVQIFQRQQARGAEWPAPRKLLRRRGRWMIVFGFLHGVLLFYGDIIAAYGVLAVLFAGAVRWKDRTLAIWVSAFLLIGSAVYGLISIPMGDQSTMFLSDANPLSAAAGRAIGMVFVAPFGALTAAAAFLLGIWAARRRILEEPERHLPFLRKLAVGGLALAALGGLPLALVIAGVVDTNSNAVVFGLGALHAASGYLGGPGWAAVIALLAVRIGSRPTGFVRAVSAVGQRSMTCYLSQSVVWAVLFPPYLLGLGSRIGVALTAVIAVCTWLLTVGLAELMRRRNVRGPFEVLLRRLTYRAKR
jgi:uncharacterized protein